MSWHEQSGAERKVLIPFCILARQEEIRQLSLGVVHVLSIPKSSVGRPGSRLAMLTQALLPSMAAWGWERRKGRDSSRWEWRAPRGEGEMDDN